MLFIDFAKATYPIWSFPNVFGSKKSGEHVQGLEHVGSWASLEIGLLNPVVVALVTPLQEATEETRSNGTSKKHPLEPLRPERGAWFWYNIAQAWMTVFNFHVNCSQHSISWSLPEPVMDHGLIVGVYYMGYRISLQYWVEERKATSLSLRTILSYYGYHVPII